MERQEEDVGAPDHGHVAEARDQEPALHRREARGVGRGGPDLLAEEAGLVGLGDEAARDVHDGHVVAAAAERGHHLCRGGEGDVALGGGAAGQHSDSHVSSWWGRESRVASRESGS